MLMTALLLSSLVGPPQPSPAPPDAADGSEASGRVSVESQIVGPVAPSPAPPGTVLEERSTPGLALGWYAFAIGGQVVDFASTLHFLASGRLEETNPRLKNIVHNAPAYLAVKIGVGLLAARVGDLIAAYGERRGFRWVVWFGRAVAGTAGVDGTYHAIRNEILLAKAR